jgi:hypothetical protein
MSSERLSGVAFGVRFLNKEAVLFAERLGTYVVSLYPEAFSSLTVFVDNFLESPDDNFWVAKVFPDVEFASWSNEFYGYPILVAFERGSFKSFSEGSKEPLSNFNESLEEALYKKLAPVNDDLNLIFNATNFSSKKVDWLVWTKPVMKV